MADQILDLNYDTPQEGITIRGLVSSAITGITNAASAVVTAANEFANGDQVLIETVLGMTQINGRVGTVSGVSATGFTLDIASNVATIAPVAVQTTDNLSPAVINSTSHLLAVGDSVLFYGMTEHTELNGKQAIVVAVATANQYTIDYDATGDTDEATGGFGVKIADMFGVFATSASSKATVVGAVTNHIRVTYDDTQSESNIVGALTRAREKLIVVLPE